MLDFQDVVNNPIKCEPRFDAGRFIEMIVIERALNDFSK